VNAIGLALKVNGTTMQTAYSAAKTVPLASQAQPVITVKTGFKN